MRTIVKLIWKRLLFVLAIAMILCCAESPKPDAEVKVDVSHIHHTMRGGMGASWHAIIKELHEIPVDETYKYPLIYDQNRGSGFAGNPPISDTSAWRQVEQYASWLGMNFIRVELSQRMYEPEQAKYDWENEEMQALFRILDWCQQQDADVFLQQMWAFSCMETFTLRYV